MSNDLVPQQPLPPEFERILHENLPELYVREPPYVVPLRAIEGGDMNHNWPWLLATAVVVIILLVVLFATLCTNC
jgi:hypothetical protein